ncbi:hypothetical protein D7Z26_13610 [Cohnella endophytica]|uniref:WGxxGxxG-CTERM domain-containing protein n=1 Tax=Cohnella endophytica TaxID=2419778 RepID=A0A494Y3A3_9BACL|nr:WGxxGxxG family protein [Cohnella endophytica]RKP54386.1 hypothetical protein D7Z26_13610 [Cohnella endophytica]
MKKLLSSLTLLSALSLTAAVPSFAEHSSGHATDKSLDGTIKTPAPTSLTIKEMTSGRHGVHGNGYYDNTTGGPTGSLYGTNAMNQGTRIFGVDNRNGITGTTGTTGTTGHYGTYGTTGHYGDYGTGYNSRNYSNGNYGSYDSTRMNTYRPYSTYNTNNLTPRAKSTVRAMSTTTKRSFNWGWLGLLGLFGLAGMRSRSRDEVR